MEKLIIYSFIIYAHIPYYLFLFFKYKKIIFQ